MLSLEGSNLGPTRGLLLFQMQPCSRVAASALIRTCANLLYEACWLSAVFCHKDDCHSSPLFLEPEVNCKRELQGKETDKNKTREEQNGVVKPGAWKEASGLALSTMASSRRGACLWVDG